MAAMVQCLRSLNLTVLIPLVCLFPGLAISGCGGRGDGTASAPGGAATPKPTTASLQPGFGLATRTVPAEVQSLIIRDDDAAGLLLYGTETRTLATQVVLVDVPWDVKPIPGD